MIDKLIPGALDRALHTGGVSVDGISIGDSADKRTWLVQPASLQSAAQSIIDAFDAAGNESANARWTTQSRQKDVLATMAMIVRARNIPAWNSMTLQQKKDATFAEADVWINIRDFIEANL